MQWQAPNRDHASTVMLQQFWDLTAPISQNKDADPGINPGQQHYRDIPLRFPIRQACVDVDLHPIANVKCICLCYYILTFVMPCHTRV